MSSARKSLGKQAVGATSASAAATPKKGKQSSRMPPPPPPAEAEDEEEQFSEPEEVDNDQMQQEMEDDAEEDDEDDMDEDEDADSGDAAASSGAVSGQKRGADGAAAGANSAKKSKSGSFVIPSSEEMAALRQTEELFQSNLFKLALDELLKNISVDYTAEGKVKKIEPILHALKGKIEGMASAEMTYNPLAPAFGAPFPSAVSTSVASAAASASGTTSHAFTFHAPSAFRLVGSYPLHTGMREPTASGRAALNIDLSLEIPEACLKQKDYWDYRYLAKRARWLQHIGEELQRSGEFEVKVGKMRGATEKPVLLLYPQKSAGVPQTGMLGKIVVRVFANPPTNFFSAKRFHPSKSNIHAVTAPVAVAVETKGKAGKVKKETPTPAAADESTGAPTPYYNSLIAEDLFYPDHLTQLYDMAQSQPIRETLLLLRLWARQRRLDLGRGASENGGWGEFDLAWSKSASSGSASTKKGKKSASAVPSADSRLELVSPAAYLYDSPSAGMCGFNGFFFSMFLLHLVQTKAVYRAMSTYQLFKQALQQLLKLDMLAKGVSGQETSGGVLLGFDPSKSLHTLTLLTNPLAAGAAVPKEADMLSSWSAANGHEVIFLDGEGLVNFAARITRSTYLELKQEAFLSLSLLDDSATLLSNIFGNGMLDNAASAAAAGGAPATATPSVVALQALLSTSKPLPSSANLGGDTFSALFMNPLDFATKFDAFARIQLPPASEWSIISAKLSQTMGRSFLAPKAGLALDADALSVLLRQISALLELALGDRIILMHLRPVFTAATGNVTLDIGLLLNPFHASRILDSGPSADSEPAAQRFRDLWGELSTLRRFKDGAIVEAVVWTTPNTSTNAASSHLPHSSPHLIPFQILSYVLGRHLAIAPAGIEFVVNQFDSLLKLRAIDSQPTATQLLSADATGRTPLLLSGPTVDPLFLHSTSLFASFKGLSSALKSLHEEIPLAVVAIRMTGEFSRYTGVFPPTPIDILQLAPNTPAHALGDVVPVLMQFESSSKWPEDSLAISRIKSAFYIQIGRALQSKDIQSLVSLQSLDIFYHGFVFRLKLHYEQELKIRQAEEKMGQVALGSAMIPVPTSTQIQREFVFGPLLSQQLKFVQETYPLFAPTARLVKRWLGAHMFSPFFPCAEVIELLVAHLFTNPKPYTVPGTSLQAFHRWLQWLATIDFASTPVVVDLTGEMKSETIEVIQAKFALHRKDGTGSLIYIATEADKESQLLFPRNADGKETNLDTVILARLATYARGSLAHLDRLLAGNGGASASAAVWKSAFKTPTDLTNTFDVLIHLRTDVMPVHQLAKALAPPAAILSATAAASSEDKKSGYKLPPDAFSSPIAFSSTGASSSHSVPLVSFSPVSALVSSLRHIFGSRAYFFYDAHGGSVIGIKWRSEFKQLLSATEPVKFSVKATQHAKPHHDKKGNVTGLEVNLEEILSDIRRAGTGLIDRVEA